MIHKIDYKKIFFLLSAPNIQNLPTDNTIEIAFIGRSNSGKSSTINTLTQKKIAKTSKKSGCTKLINLFEIPFKIRLVDFPGYGYSNLSKTKKKKWETTLNEYLKIRKNIKGIIIIIDIRRSITQIDQNIIQKIQKTNIPILILLNKSDKLSKNKLSIQLNTTKKILFSKNIKIITFSSKSSKGVNNLQKIIKFWYKNTKKCNQ